MDPKTVYIKTALGQQEIATRAQHLSSRMRTMLILVDGRRTTAELLAQNSTSPEAESHLAALLEGGFIAIVSSSVPPAAPVAAPVPVPTTDIAAIKDFICTALRESIGPDADMFAVKVESANTLPDLRQQAEKIREVMRSAIGNRKADLFWEKLSSMMP